VHSHADTCSCLVAEPDQHPKEGVNIALLRAIWNLAGSLRLALGALAGHRVARRWPGIRPLYDRRKRNRTGVLVAVLVRAPQYFT
jgi:hypothetical protein